ncbi:MAG: hypothetical protein ACKVS6_11170 [Planctomycetota bacterium]
MNESTKCKNCGATLSGRSSKCEFCGGSDAPEVLRPSVQRISNSAQQESIRVDDGTTPVRRGEFTAEKIQQMTASGRFFGWRGAVPCCCAGCLLIVGGIITLIISFFTWLF